MGTETVEFVILLDVGHSVLTAGKRQRKDDGSYFFEYKSNRAIGKLIYEGLRDRGIKCFYVVNPDLEKDTPLNDRVAVANKYSKKYGKNNCLLISIHSNAFGDGKTFTKAGGWCCYTCKGETKSDHYAEILYEEAEKILPKYGFSLRRNMSDGDSDYEENFTMVYKTICPALLSENLFFTNCCEMRFLESEVGQQVIANIHLNAIERIIAEKKAA